MAMSFLLSNNKIYNEIVGGNKMIHTVTGPIEKETLGFTLAHEHLAWEYLDSWRLYFDKIYDENRVDDLYDELLPVFQGLFKQGCRTIVEASPPRGGQNLKLMQELSKNSGINIIANTGLPFKTYVYKVHHDFDEATLAQRWIDDYTKGLDTIDGIKIIPAQIKLLLGDEGEGSLTSIDQKLLKAARIASQKTGMPIHCHLLKATAAREAIELLANAHFDFSKFLWAHACNEGDFEVMDLLYSKGGWLGFDQIRPGDYPKYCTLIQKAMKKGYTNRILLSQDYDFLDEVRQDVKNHLCCSFFTKFIEYASNNGISKDIIIEMISKNPSEFLDICN